MDHVSVGARTLAVGSLAALTACFDFGYDIDAPPDLGVPDGTMADGSGVDGIDCTEGPAEPSASGPQVQIATLQMTPAMLDIHAGDTVTWTNNDSMRHTVTAGAPGAVVPAAQGGFDSGEIASGTSWAYRFCALRQAFYFCQTHPSQMNGYRLNVQP